MAIFFFIFQVVATFIGWAKKKSPPQSKALY